MPGNTGGSGSPGGNPIGFGAPGAGIFHPQTFRSGDILPPALCYKDAVLALTPLAYWRLGEPSGTNAVDDGGSDDGTYTNTPTLGVTGLVPADADTAVTFLAASSEYVVASAAPYTLANGPFSFAVAFKTTASGANFCLAFFGHIAGPAGKINLALGPSANGKVSVMDGTNRIITSATAGYNDGNPHFAFVTKSVLNEWHLYIDGLDVGVDDSTPHVATTTAIDTHTYIGAKGEPSIQQFFTGTLDEVAVFGTELSKAQVAFLYAAKDVACAVAGQSLTADATDAVTFGDVATRTLDALRTVTDAVTRSDAATRLGVFARTLTDSTTWADAATRLGVFLRTVTDAVTRSDAATQTKTILRTVTDAVTYADAATRLGVFARAVTDSVTRSDAATRLGVFARTVTDSATYGDVASRVLSASRSLADSVTRADVATRLGVFARTVTDAVSYSDVAAQVKTILRVVTDAIARIDAAVGSVLGGSVTPRQQKDGSSASTTSLTITLDALPLLGNTLTVQEGNTGGGAAIASGQGGVTTWNFVENFAGNYDVHVFWGIVDTTPSASVTITLPSGRIAAKVVEWPGAWVGDQSTYASGNSATASSGSVTPLFSNELVVAAGVSFQTLGAPSGGFTDLGGVFSAAFETDSAYLVESTPVAASTTWSMVIDDWVGAIVSLTRGASLARTVADAIARSDVATKVLGAVRDASDAIQRTDFLVRLGTFGRTISETITRADLGSRFFSPVRSAVDAVTRSDAATQTKTFLRSVSDAVTRSDVATRAGSFVRTIADAVHWADSVPFRSGHALARTVSDAIHRFDRAFGSHLPNPPSSPQDKVEYVDDQGAPPDGA